jgi:hypothetical protein
MKLTPQELADRLSYTSKPKIRKFEFGGSIDEKKATTLPEVGVVGTRNSPAYQAYQDSLNLYNKGLEDQDKFKKFMDNLIPDSLVNEGWKRHPTTYYTIDNDDNSTYPKLVQPGSSYSGSTEGGGWVGIEKQLPQLKNAKSSQLLPIDQTTYNKIIEGYKLYKKPTNPPNLNKSSMTPIKALPKPVREVKTREFTKPKFNESKTDFNFYGMFDAAAWGDDNRPAGYYDIGEGRVNVSMKDLANMDADARGALFNILGNNTVAKFDAAVELLNEKRKYIRKK